MHLSSALLVLATALTGASAHPSAHPHNHARLHNRAPGKFLKDLVRPDPATPTPTPDPTPTPEPEPEQEEPKDEPKPSGGKKAFCAANAKRATLADIMYKGNTGGSGSSWGCNIMQVDCSTIDLYDYTAQFESTGSSDTFACSAFNKIGPTGLVDGFWHSAMDFNLKKGQNVCLAFDTNSQGGVACGAGSVPRTKIGQMAGTWLEFDAGSTRNGGQSGSDVSVIVADVEGMTDWVSMKIDAPGKGVCSLLSKADPSKDFEVYRKGMEDLDGVGCTGYSKGTIFVTLGD